MNELIEAGVMTVLFFGALYIYARIEEKKIRDKDKLEFKE
jgi:hypothetical protein